MIEVDENWGATKVITPIIHDELERVVASLSIKYKKEFVILTFPKDFSLVPFKAPAKSKFVIESIVSQGMTRSRRCYTTKELTSRR